MTLIKKIYKKKGLNGLYAFLRKSKIEFTTEVVEFGWDSEKARNEKERWLTQSPLSFHYYSTGGKARSGFQVNMLRGIKIIITLFQTSEKNPTFSTRGNGVFGNVKRTGWERSKDLTPAETLAIINALDNSNVDKVYKRGKVLFAFLLNGREKNL